MVTDRILVYLGQELYSQYAINCSIGGTNPTSTGAYLTQYNTQESDFQGQDVQIQLLVVESDTTEHKAFIKAQNKAKDILSKIKNIIDVYGVNEIPVLFDNGRYFYSINFTTTEEV